MAKSVVIIGGGVAGMAAAGKLRGFGYDVVLIEKAQELGGNVKNWYKVFPDFTDASEIIGKLKGELNGTRVVTGATVTSITVTAPNFHVSISTGEEIEAAAILVATGFKPFDAALKEEYGYGIYDNSITSIELDAMLKHHCVRTASGTTPKKVAMIHCVGSRDEKVNNNYCSRVCCTNTIKQAMEIKQQIPDCDNYCLYMVQRGEWEKVLQSNSLWLCTSCQICTSRCPRGVRPSDVIEAVKAIAIREGINNDSTRFNQIFVELIEKRGILFEPELMQKYGGMPAMLKQAKLGMKLALRGKLSPLPAKVKNPQKFSQALSKASQP